LQHTLCSTTARFKAVDGMRRRARFDGAQRDFALHIEARINEAPQEVLAMLSMRQLQAQGVTAQYPRMAPTEQYLMGRNAEIALARSAAPEVYPAMRQSWSLGGMGTRRRFGASMGSFAWWHEGWWEPLICRSFGTLRFVAQIALIQG
jgi:hypothetical protein